MSKYDGTNIEKVASREPDGTWACCLCNGWKNRGCDDKDFKYTDEQIFLHLRDAHHIKTKTLQQSDYKSGWEINESMGKPTMSLYEALKKILEVK